MLWSARIDTKHITLLFRQECRIPIYCTTMATSSWPHLHASWLYSSTEGKSISSPIACASLPSHFWNTFCSCHSVLFSPYFSRVLWSHAVRHTKDPMVPSNMPRYVEDNKLINFFKQRYPYGPQHLSQNTARQYIVETCVVVHANISSPQMAQLH